MLNFEGDIIVGISTAFAEGAISIIRLSGKGCIELVNSVFKGKDLTKAASHTINYGYIMQNNEMLDEVLISVFRSPKTYTVEDVIEINCHGGLFVTNQIYELMVLAGARPAEPGEFTKRAYLNGRIDLTEAEAVMDMIEAENKAAVKMAGCALTGAISKIINKIRKEIFDVISRISVNIDYPEYEEFEELCSQEIQPQILHIKDEINELLSQSNSAKYIKNGIDTAIIGQPNVGKSSLLNSLLGEKKAIVTNIPGTTRDSIEAKINLGSVTLNLIDTAGIRQTDDVVESIGVDISKEKLNNADLVLLLLDSSRQLTLVDKELIDSAKDKNHLIVMTKDDLPVKNEFSNYDLKICTSNTDDIEKLKKLIQNKLNVENIQNKDITYISNARQIEKLKKAHEEIIEALNEIENSAFIDMVEIPLNAAWLYLGEIIGETSTEDFLDELFKNFCLGK